MRLALRALCLGLVATLALSACTIGREPPDSPPNTQPSVTPTPSSVDGFDVYWVADTQRGLRLFREHIEQRAVADPVLQALRYLVAHQPADADYTNLWPSGSAVNSASVGGGLVTVDLTFTRLNVGAEGESMAIQQLLWTAAAADAHVERIAITRDGSPVESLAGHVDTTTPIAQPPTYEVFAAVWIVAPIEGARLNGEGFDILGMASTFEANVVWSIERDGTQVRGGSTTAGEAAPAWAPWKVHVAGLAPGEYVVTAAEYSPKDGSLVVRDTKEIRVS